MSSTVPTCAKPPTAANGDVCPLCEYFRCRCNGVQPQHPAGGAR